MTSPSRAKTEALLNRLRTVAAWYATTGRQVGHTTAILCGSRSDPRAKIVVHSLRMGEIIHRQSQGRNQTILLDCIEEGLKGHTGPICWDNAALVLLLGECATAIHDLIIENGLLRTTTKESGQ